jgi:hypothetical protein
LSWQEALRLRFPDSGAAAARQQWRSSPPKLAVGQAVEGVVVARAPFGVWLDIGVGHAALLLVTNMDGVRTVRLGFEDYPPLGAHLVGHVYVLGPDAEIGITQLTNPTSLSIGPAVAPAGSDDDLWAALRANGPVEALTTVVLAWKVRGVTAAEAEQRLTAFLHVVMNVGVLDEDDPVRDVLDFVTGECSPHSRLFP